MNGQAVGARQHLQEAALISRLAYNPGIGPRYLEQLGHHGQTTIRGPIGTLALCTMKDDTAWVAFAGTDDLMDATVDVFFIPACWPPRHSGFQLAWHVLRDEVRTWLRQHGPRQVIVTGHSLGGAMAYCAALDLSSEFPIEAVTTFGAPRAFWGPGKSIYTRQPARPTHANQNPETQATLGDVTVRVTHGSDLVPMIVPPWLGFFHVGTPSPIGTSKLAESGSAALTLIEFFSGSGVFGLFGLMLINWSWWPAAALLLTVLLVGIVKSGGQHGSAKYLDQLGVAAPDKESSFFWSGAPEYGQAITVNSSLFFRVLSDVFFLLGAAMALGIVGALFWGVIQALGTFGWLASLGAGLFVVAAAAIFASGSHLAVAAWYRREFGSEAHLFRGVTPLGGYKGPAIDNQGPAADTDTEHTSTPIADPRADLVEHDQAAAKQPGSTSPENVPSRTNAAFVLSGLHDKPATAALLACMQPRDWQKLMIGNPVQDDADTTDTDEEE